MDKGKRSGTRKGDKVGMWIVRLREEKCIRPSEMKRANEMSVVKNAAYPSEEHT